MLNNLHPDQQPAPRVQHTAMNMRMKKSYFLLLFALCAAFRLLAQPATSEHPILNTTQLDMQHTYDNLDSALANPDKVYKLTLTKQKIKLLPEEFGTLVNLQQLIVSECKLKEIPLQIRECKNLQMIVFSGNKIRVIPVEMRELKHLEILYLGKNKIMEIPSWFGNLTKLKRLDISRNALTPADVSNARRMLPKADITF
jgi:Leucine-rich repeat (LRR) protein